MRWFATLSAVAFVAACSGPPGESGTTITNVRIVDGTGAPARAGTVRIVADTIVAVGDVSPLAGDSILDGNGLVLAPGFIDTHSHQDFGLGKTPDAAATVSQGITTIVAGNDGGHPYPLARAFDSLTASGHAPNIAFYAGHGSLRTAVMGNQFKRHATATEVDSMAALLRIELAAGALGLSTGLEYDPGIYADRAEVLALAKVAAAAGSRYISHIRSEDRDFWDAIDEVLTIGREAKLPVQISHLKLAMVPLWGQADSLLRRLDAARAQGVDVTADIYPYTYWHSTLQVLFPKRDFANRAEALKILKEIVPADGLLIGVYAAKPEYAGKTVAQIAEVRHEDPASTLMGLIRESQAYQAQNADHAMPSAVESVVATAMQEADVRKLIQWEHTNVCSDGELNGAHPRGFGAFPRVLGRYVREEKVLGLEAAIHKMTALSAQHVGITNRGRIAPGQAADLVLLDPAMVVDRATPAEPHNVSAGIVRVWVNGVTVWRNGRPTGSHPGRIIKRARIR